MKKNLLILLSTAMLAYSCSKDKVEQETVPPAILYGLQTAPNKEALTQMYKDLSPEQRYSLWKGHFQYWMDSAEIRADRNKLNLVTSLYYSLNPAIFIDSSNERNIFLNYTLPAWLTSAQRIFNKKEVFELIMQNRLMISQPNVEEVGLPDCFCHLGSTGYSCKKWKYNFPFSVSVEYGICESGGSACDPSRLGCGALWLQSCNGNHCNF